MADLKYYDLKKKKNYIYFLKIFNIILLIWMYIPYYYKGDSARSLNKRKKIDKILEIYFQRSLAKHEYKKNLDSSSLKEKLPDHRIHMEIKKKKNMSTYGHLNKEGLNELEAYKKSYKSRYSKKKGLAKLECYCEKKVFDKLDNIYELSKKMKDDKKSYKKKLFSKYGYDLISFCLLPLLGLIYYILYGSNDIGAGIIKFCEHAEHNSDKNKNCAEYMYNEYKDSLDCVSNINAAYSFIMTIIVVCFIIYILIKVIKYERIKAKKGKMSMKEYFRFSKEIFNITSIGNIFSDRI